MTNIDMEDTRYTSRQAAEYLGLAPSYLLQLMSWGRGPSATRLGRGKTAPWSFYQMDLDTWSKEHQA